MVHPNRPYAVFLQDRFLDGFCEEAKREAGNQKISGIACLTSHRVDGLMAFVICSKSAGPGRLA
jgi:hypothetical protein